MRLRSLSIRDFRNLESIDVDTDARFVVFHGANAQGKTNCLEAIYCLATLKSFRTHRNRDLIRFGAERALVKGKIQDLDLQREFKFLVTPKGRRGEVDGSRPEKLRSYFEGIRAVQFAPEDTEIVRGEPTVRRKFLDRAAFTARPTYLELYQSFRRVLEQRSALLRSPRVDTVQLEVYDDQLVAKGARVSVARQEVVKQLRDPFESLHGSISGGGKGTLRYRGCLGEGTVEEQAEVFREKLAARRAEELRRRMNLVGPQRDDLSIDVGGHPARAFASQGQTRSLVLALKLAELVAARERGIRLLFLLDDLSSELDRARTDHLLELLQSLDVQTFVSTTDPERLGGLPADQIRSFEVRSGSVQGDG